MADTIIKFIEDYGLLAITLAIALEYACFPLPSELVLPLSGAVAAQGKFNFWAVYLLSIGAGLVGSFICYAIGRFGGAPILEKLEKKFPKMGAGIISAQRQFEKYSTVAVGLCRVVPLCRTYISFVAGISKQNPVVFAAASAAGIGAWNALLVGLGYMFSSNWPIVMEIYDRYKLPVLIGAVLLVAAYFFIKRAMDKKEAKVLEAYQKEKEQQEK